MSENTSQQLSYYNHHSILLRYLHNTELIKLIKIIMSELNWLPLNKSTLGPCLHLVILRDYYLECKILATCIYPGRRQQL